MEKTLGNLDQIYDAYKGDLGDGLMLSTKERFAWQASMVEGENILDVGCSQGILDILLAREGKEVLGIDILQDAIDFAEKLKRKESTTTQKNVNFLSGEFTQTQINQTFDTIILGEIIEHQYYPEKIIEKAHKILKDSGVLIITVPFGINDYYDHRKTYYLYDLLKLIRKGFKIEHIYYGQARISADWIGIKVRKNPNFKTDKKTLLLIKDLEKAFYKREREYMKNLSKKKKSISYFSNIVEKLSKAEENYKSTINYKNIQIKNLKDANREYLKEIKEKEKIIKKYNKRKIIRILKLFKKATKIPLKILVEIKRKLSKFYYTIVKILYKPFNKFKKSNLLKLSKSIPDSNGSFYFNKSDAKIGVITDELAYRYYQGAVDIKYINYDNYKEIIDSGIDFLLFITCWYGMKENDWYGLVSNAEIQDKLFKIFDYAKEKDIKIVFQSKEDPSNYQSFLSIAQKADYIFTTDKNKIENYKRDTKNKNVFLLKFGINPLIHNPIGMNDNKRGKFFTRNSVFFAGSWNKRYEERCKDMKLIFNGIRKSGKNLLIADRNYYKKQFNYPSKFLRFLIPNFDYIDLQKIHKLFDWNININSIKSSPTMCAARIYELQALGSLVISNYSLSVYKDFPNIFIINNPSEIKPTLKNYSQKELYKLKIEGIRNVFEKDTVFHRLNFMFEKIGLNKKILYKDNVLVLCEKKTQKVLEMFKKQTYHKKELFLISEVDDIEIQKYDYFTFFSEDNQYGEYYLEDIINCFKFVDVPYVTKKSHFYKNKLKAHSHVYTSSYENKYKTVFNVHEIKITDVLLNKKIKRNGYISDALNLNEQTFPIDNFVNKKKAKLGIVIPVFNNGKFLYGKAFLSLLRNSFFNKIKILLIDDGSNDEKTIVTIKKLAESHKNVMAYFFPKGGSGSPSRARNMGINLLDTEYISFLDPDDEIINQSYEKLLKVLRSYKNLDCIFGFNFMIREGILTKVYSEKKDTIIRNPKEYLIRKRFHLGRIDSAIFRRNFLVNKKLRFLEDSFGEDSLFFIELMLNSPVVYYKHTPVSLYYNDNPESCVNNISHSFFHKYLLKEKILKKKLQKNNLLKKYKEKRFLFYFKDWYCKKLEKVNPKDYKESIYKLKEIASIFSYDIEKKINKKNFDYIQDSNGTSYYKKFEKNIAIITDNLAFEYFYGSANYFYVNSDNYSDILKNENIDMLLFVSCWRGMKNEDWRGISYCPKKRNDLIKILKYYKQKDVPIVFWSKEDPIHYDIYCQFAQNADYIFTTAQESISDYKLLTKNEKVYLSSYGINPLMHNPIGTRMKNYKNFDSLDKVLFAGSWYKNHVERKEDQSKLFDGIIKSNKELLIIDRNFFISNKNSLYPQKYWNYLYPSIEYKKLQKFHKLFDWALNLNIVKNSTTMCAARVYELQALGVSIISNPSIAVRNNFPNIFLADNQEEVTQIINETSDEEIYRRQTEGIRNAYTNSTVYDRVGEILHKVGLIENKPETRNITVIYEKNEKKITEMFDKQTYKNKILVEKSEIDFINQDSFIAFFSPNYEYGANYLQDMVNAFKYTDVAFITKDEKVEHNYVNSTKDKYCSIFNQEKIPLKKIVAENNFDYKGYSIDSFELKKLN